MRNYIAVVFKDRSKAYEGLHALWVLDGLGSVTVHGSAVVHRTLFGVLQVDTKETSPALATAVGVGVGALIGMFGGPAGMAVGAVAGAGLGVIADLGRADTRQEAFIEAGFVLLPGQTAVLVDVSEDWNDPIDTRMRELGGLVFRRAKDDVRNDSRWDASSFYPYEYVPGSSAVY